MKYTGILLFVIASSMIIGCKKFIAVKTPSTSISQENVYATDATAAAVLTGIYTDIGQGGSLLSTSYLTGLSSDELSLFSGSGDQKLLSYYKNNLKTIVNTEKGLWTAYSSVIYQTNAAISGLNSATLLSPNVRQQLLGEAYFVRAFYYFYLVNEYGDIPLALSTDYKVNSVLTRSPTEKVYEQIISDLQQAKNLLNDNYLDATVTNITEARVRPNKAAASSLLARTYLYKKNYPLAEAEATSVIQNTHLYDTVRLNEVFKMNSKETIWAIQPVRGATEQNAVDGRNFIIMSGGPITTYLSDHLSGLFELGDQRKINWTRNATVSGKTYSFAYKYKIGYEDRPTEEYNMMLRLGEVYLIRAEARARQNKMTGADDLNVIRKRASLSNTTATTPDLLLEAIARERQTELFAEWGHRWFDLKRTGKIDEVMKIVAPIKGGTWDTQWSLYPIVLSELNANPNLQQNPGYE